MLKIDNDVSYKEFIEEHSIPVTECGCWLWQCDDSNDDFVQLAGKVAKVEDVAYEAFYGKPPTDRKIVHECHIACCVNPRHMHIEPG
jgi:hypothetical protein